MLKAQTNFFKLHLNLSNKIVRGKYEDKSGWSDLRPFQKATPMAV